MLTSNDSHPVCTVCKLGNCIHEAVPLVWPFENSCHWQHNSILGKKEYSAECFVQCFSTRICSCSHVSSLTSSTYRRQLCVKKFPYAEISKCRGFISFRMQRTAAAAAGLMPSSWRLGVTRPFKSPKMKTLYSQHSKTIPHETNPKQNCSRNFKSRISQILYVVCTTKSSENRN